jgi:hypothetical protein
MNLCIGHKQGWIGSPNFGGIKKSHKKNPAQNTKKGK